MNRIQASLAAASVVLVAAALTLGRPGDAVSQTTPGHQEHGAAAAKPAPQATGKSAATPPTKTPDGRYTLPGVPPGKLAMGGGVTTVITGEVMDPACFLEAGDKSVGKGHFQCAVDCARSGQTLAIYDRELDRIYFIAGELPGRNPNDPVFKYMHQKVDVTGTVFHRSQAWGIVIVAVAPHNPKGAAAASASAPTKK
ncbi:MAG TPA: hypothetical protein VLT84_04325 [Acidobacteriota bacterium]|nr:hypothetical protein [Acidobacteriota bacterium]